MYRMAPPNLPRVLTAFNFLIGKAQSTRRAECDVTSLVYRNNGIPGNVKDNTHILLSATWWNGYYRYVTTQITHVFITKVQLFTPFFAFWRQNLKIGTRVL